MKRVNKTFDKGLPNKNMLLEFIFNFDFLVKIPPFSFIIKKSLKNCRNFSFSKGFRFLYGNIKASNVGFANTIFLDYSEIIIGKNTNFGWDNMVITGSHDKDDFSKIISSPITIGENVFITSRCVIQPGVKIGSGAIIAPGTVVTKDVPENVLFAGNPGTVIKKIR